MTICPIHLFGKPIDILITQFDAANLRQHRFEDRLNLLHFFHIGDDAFEIVFVFTEVHRCAHTRTHEQLG